MEISRGWRSPSEINPCPNHTRAVYMWLVRFIPVSGRWWAALGQLKGQPVHDRGVIFQWISGFLCFSCCVFSLRACLILLKNTDFHVFGQIQITGLHGPLSVFSIFVNPYLFNHWTDSHQIKFHWSISICRCNCHILYLYQADDGLPWAVEGEAWAGVLTVLAVTWAGDHASPVPRWNGNGCPQKQWLEFSLLIPHFAFWLLWEHVWVVSPGFVHKRSISCWD